MKKPESTKKVLSRRSFMKLAAVGGGALYLLGKVGNSLAAQDLEVYSELNKAKDINAGACSCAGIGGGSGGSCLCGGGGGCGGTGS